jgi:hypothetical protein
LAGSSLAEAAAPLAVLGIGWRAVRLLEKNVQCSKKFECSCHLCNEIRKLAYPETDPLFLEVKVTGPRAFLRFWTTSLIDCDGSQLLSFMAVATTLRLGSQSKLSVVTPK